MPNTKYKRKFAKQLLAGMRKDGLTVDEICLIWGIGRTTYWEWKQKYPIFAEACEFGDMQFSAFYARKYRAVADGKEKGNAGMLIFAAKNVMGWAEKTETHTTHEEEVKLVKIEILPSRQNLELLEQRPNNIIELKPEVVEEIVDDEG